MYFNRFAPYTMGWQLYNALLMEDGKMVYKDFLNYLPPGSLIRTIWAYAITGGSILGYRFICIIERVVVSGVLFCILTRYFKPKYTWLACAIGTVFVATTDLDQFGDYNQTYKLYLLIATYFGIKFFDSLGNTRKENVWMLLCGISMGMIMLFKQSIGVIAPIVFFAFLVLFSIIEKNKSFFRHLCMAVCGYVIPLAICFGWLFFNDAFFPMIDQVVKSSAAKGSTSTIFLRFFVNIAHWDTLVLFITFLLILVLNKIKFKYLKTESYINILLILTWILFIHLFIRQYANYIVDFFNASIQSGYLYFLEIMAFAMVFISQLKFNKISNLGLDLRKNHDFIYLGYLVIAVFFSIYIIYALPIEATDVLYDVSSFSNAKYYLPIFAAYCVFALLIFCCVYYIKYRKPYKSLGFFLIVLACFLSAYEGAMSTGTNTITFITTNLTIPLSLCMALEYIPVNKIIRKYKNVLIICTCVICCSLASSQVITNPFTWWGWKSDSITAENNYSIDIPRMEGFRVSLREKNLYEQVNQLITLNSSEEDFVFTFPHIKLFNILSDRMSTPTFVGSYYFDVCSDEYALADAKILEANYPKIIVEYDSNEEFWEYNENSFRGGNSSGQRKIQEWIDAVTETAYTKIGSVQGINVYKLNDGSEIQYSYFENSDPVIENAINKDDSFSYMNSFFTQIGVNSEAFSYSKVLLWAVIILVVLIAFFCLNEQWKKFILIFGIFGSILQIYPMYFLGLIIPLAFMKVYSKKDLKTITYVGLLLMTIFPIIMSYTELWSKIRIVPIISFGILFAFSVCDGVFNGIKKLKKIYPNSFNILLLIQTLIFIMFILMGIVFSPISWWGATESRVTLFRDCSCTDYIITLVLIFLIIEIVVLQILKHRRTYNYESK